MKYLDVKWNLYIDPEAELYMDSASNGEIDYILEKIAEGVKEGFFSGLFTIEIE